MLVEPCSVIEALGGEQGNCLGFGEETMSYTTEQHVVRGGEILESSHEENAECNGPPCSYATI